MCSRRTSSDSQPTSSCSRLLGMSSVHRRIGRTGKTSWRAVWREPSGAQRNESFARKIDAERYLATVDVSVMEGSYVDPGRSRLTVAAWSSEWLATLGHVKPTTRERYRGVLSNHVLPQWGEVKLSQITYAAIESWCSRLAAAKSPSTAVKAHRVMSLILELAVRDGRLAKNPALGVKLAREQPRERGSSRTLKSPSSPRPPARTPQQ